MFAGLITAIVFVFWMVGADPKTDPKGYADAAAGIKGVGPGYLYIVGLVGLMLGLVALYAILAQGGRNLVALWGLVSSVLSICLLVAVQGGSALGGAVAAQAYLDGNAGAADVMVKFSGGSFGHALMVGFGIAVVFGALGALSFAVAIWNSGVLSRSTAVVFGLALLLSIFIMPFVSQVGELLLIVAGFQIARTGASRPTASRSEMVPTA